MIVVNITEKVMITVIIVDMGIYSLVSIMKGGKEDMTEKRFTYRYNGDCESEWEIIDLDDDVYYGMDTTEHCVKSLVELLNELFDENEQLKQRNDTQYNQLDQLWELIQAKDWETLTAMDNEMKENDERLKREWKCYE